MHKRWQEKSIQNALKNRRIIIISGSRQCGKSTLSKMIAPQEVTYRTLDSTNLLELAQSDPATFLKHNKKTMVIDEIQKAPKLIPEIKIVVDNDTRNGQFILTGSANIQKLPTVTESLAGRVKNIILRTFSQGEINDTVPCFFENLKSLNFKDQYDCSKEKIVTLALNGGYPEPLLLNKKNKQMWFDDYVFALLDQDLRDISNLNRIDMIKETIEIIASWSSKYLDVNKICSACSVSKPTFYSYMGWFEKLYLCERVSPWIWADYDRIGKKDKFYITDSGLLSSILQWNIDDVLLDKDRSGKLIESFVFHELSVLTGINPDYKLYQYRDRENREIDFIIQDINGNIIAIEVKAGSSVGKEDFKHIKWFKEHLVKDKTFTGIVLYTGTETLYYGENLLAIPMCCLWE